MRFVLVSLALAVPAMAQVAQFGDTRPPAVRLGAPGALAAPAPIPQTGTFNPLPEGTPPYLSGTIVSPGVRPPMPVSGAPEEIPPGPMYWLSVDYMYLRANGGQIPPLFEAAGGVAAIGGVPGRLALPLTNEEINKGPYSAVRLTGGLWLDKPNGTGVEISTWWLLQEPDTNTYSGGPGISLGRPFVNALTNTPALFRLSTPSQSVVGLGRVTSALDADSFEINYLRRGPALFGDRMHWILGLRYFGLDETLTTEFLSRGALATASGFDTFATRNRFFGGQFGARWNLITRDRFTLTLTGKLAFGPMYQEALIRGGSGLMLADGTRATSLGGLLALPTNIGDHNRTKFAVLRDMGLNLNVCLTDHITLRIGYETLWASSVARPGGQIDGHINPTLMPLNPIPATGIGRPLHRFDGETFWLHGASLGLLFEF